MSLGELINDAVNWVSEEIQKSIDDLSEPLPPTQSERTWQPAGQRRQVGRAASSSRLSGVPGKIVPFERLTCWQNTASSCGGYADDDGHNNPPDDTPGGSTATQTPTSSNAEEDTKCAEVADPLPFRVHKPVNRCVYLYEGDICALRTDCLMCFTTDGFNSSDGLAARLLSIGGEELYAELTYQDTCRAGEARMCRSFNLPSTHIAYTVSPRFTSKYVTATHNALNSSIREAFFLMKEAKLRTIAIPCLPPKYASTQKSEAQRGRSSSSGDPDPTASIALGGEYCVMHTMLRSVRRWMEKMRGDIDGVVLVLGTPSDASIYRQYVRAYFPRTRGEELDAPFLLPREVGNANGEIDVAERRIRLNKKNGKSNVGSNIDAPQKTEISLASDRADSRQIFGGMLAPQEHSDSDDGNNSSDREILDSTDVSFRVAKSETETEKRLESLNIKFRKHRSHCVVDSSETLYQTYLRQANHLADSPAGVQLQQLQFIYPSGHDNAGRPIIVFLAAAFPAATVDSFILLLHIIRTMDPFIRDKYTLLYINSEVHHSNTPGLSLWSEFFGIMQKYEDNLDQLLVLHPGLLFKAGFTCCWPYISTHVWNGTVYLKYIKDLTVHLSSQPPQLPKYVVEYDAKPRRKILGLTL